MARVDEVPPDGGKALRYGATQIAIFNFANRGKWYATQNVCPHRGDAVLARGLLGCHDGEAKVACPMHKKTFSLETGKGLSDPAFQLHAFPVEIRSDDVWVKLPSPDEFAGGGA